MDEKRHLSNDMLGLKMYLSLETVLTCVCGYQSARVCSRLLFSVFAKHVLRSSDHQPRILTAVLEEFDIQRDHYHSVVI